MRKIPLSYEFLAYARLGDAMHMLAYCIEKQEYELNSYAEDMASDSVKYAARAMFHVAMQVLDNYSTE